MPELPEVETVRRGVEAFAIGKRVTSVCVRRSGVVRGDVSAMARTTLTGARRHGKQLALLTRRGPLACVHLGMSGSLCVHHAGEPLAAHVHVVWKLAGGGELRFRDPRRFGGVFGFADPDALHAARWSRLGPDATAIGVADLHRRLRATARALKPALLDQALVAGLGNIYVDELLHAARLHPLTPACALDRNDARRLVARMRPLLQDAIDAGGSSLRDYVDAGGDAGGFQARHRVYGRGGQACRRCRATLSVAPVAQRTTVWCDRCQPADECVGVKPTHRPGRRGLLKKDR